MSDRLQRTLKPPLCVVDADEASGVTAVRLYTPRERTVVHCVMSHDGRTTFRITRDGHVLFTMPVAGPEGSERF